MKLNPKSTTKKSRGGVPKASSVDPMYESFRRQLSASFRAKGLTEDQMSLFFDAGSDPLRIAAALAAIQAAHEDRNPCPEADNDECVF